MILGTALPITANAQQAAPYPPYPQQPYPQQPYPQQQQPGWQQQPAWQQQPPPPPPPPPATTDTVGHAGIGFRFDLGLSLLTSPPGLALQTPNGVQMTQFGSRPIVPADTTYLASGTVSIYYRTGSPLVIPLIGFEFGIPVATGYPGTYTLGPTATPLTWSKTEGSTFYDGFDFLGIGAEHWFDGFGLGFDVRPGFRYLRMTGALTQNLLTVDAEANKYTFSLHADAEACIRLGKIEGGVCLFGGPHLFEFGTWMNGFVGGIRFGAIVTKNGQP